MTRRIRKLNTIVSAAMCCALLGAGCAPAATAVAAARLGAAQAAPRAAVKAAVAGASVRLKSEMIPDMYLSPGEGDYSPQLAAPAPLDLEAAFRPAAATALSIPTTFRITRPDEKLTTTYANYFITGTSNPDLPVYIGDSEIRRLGTKGTFGVLVELALGTNTFTFRQGGATETVVIERKKEPGTAPIKEPVQSSLVPSIVAGVNYGDALSVGCTAPAGATVKASFGGRTVTLKPAREGVAAGLPVSYTGRITVDGGSYDPAVTQNAGKVVYEMTYQGAGKTFRSAGDVYVAGEDSAIAVEMVSYLGFIYPDANNLSVFKETVKAGARDYVKGQNDAYFELSSGGFIPKEMVRVVEGEVRVGNRIGSVAASVGNRSEVYAFAGTRRPIYDTKIADNTLYLTFYNTDGAPGVDISGSRLLAGWSAQSGESSVTYQFPLKGRVWGYDVAFDGTDTLLTLKYKPASLSGMTVVLDPGHGGTDPGALGLAGKTGPGEADVNLANAFAVRDLLAGMGANVIMTRTDDSYLSLDDRLRIIEAGKADVFISIHHNSIAENVDANKISGMEVYYHTGLSKGFAENMMGGLSTGLNRNNRAVKQSYYRVTLMPYAPALLVELGYMSNPVEYEKAVSQSEMNKVAAAIADGIQRSIR